MNLIKRKFFAIDEKFRFVFIGTLNTLVSLVLFFLLQEMLINFVHYLFILLINHLISVFFSYNNFRYFVFHQNSNSENNQKDCRNYFLGYFRANLVYLYGLFLNSLLLVFFVDYLHLELFISQICSIMPVAVITYVLHKYYTF